jgi:tRNA (guanine37-N1)-methyltransferase
MHIDILTIFPNMFSGPFSESIIKRAVAKQLVSIKLHDLRQWTTDSHHTVDDRPYGGGPGMVMLIEPIDKALANLKAQKFNSKPHVILTSAKGTVFTQQKAQALSKHPHLIFIAGHYEGVDQRVADNLVDEELSIGDYVLTGGELPTMVMVDSIVRLLPGVLGDDQSIVEESHSSPGFLEYPHYTRPENYKGWQVPSVLLSGNHAAIEQWRRLQSKLK